jgi:hypothetical protein
MAVGLLDCGECGGFDGEEAFGEAELDVELIEEAHLAEYANAGSFE